MRSEMAVGNSRLFLKEKSSLRCELTALVVLVYWVCGVVAQEIPVPSGDPLDLRGRVMDAEGNALAEAHIFIYTATPKTGPAYLCPSCYLDCGKRAQTNAEGGFVIEALSSSLFFRILVVCEGYHARFVPDIDPATGSVTVTMERLDLSVVAAQRIVQGRIVDGKGTPVVGASVSVDGWSPRPGTTTWGPASRVALTPVAVSNLQGEFDIAAKQDLHTVELEVRCRNFAKAKFNEVRLGESRRDFVLSEGAMVTGRLTHQGKPLPGRMMSIASEDRASRGNFTTESIATGPDGRFTFYNLPADLVYHVTGSMASIGSLGITPLSRVAELENGETRDIGDLVIKPGLSVKGKVVLSDGKHISPDARVFLNHEKFWGGQSCSLGPNGEFAFEGMHPGQVSCSIRMPGYRPAKRNGSYDDGRLVGTLNESVAGLEFLMEPGERDRNSIHRRSGIPYDQTAQFLPLCGIEALSAERLAARVRIDATEAGSGLRLDSYTVTPGWKFGENDNPAWLDSQERTLHSTDTVIEIDRRSGPAYLRVAAEGFLPVFIRVDGKIDETISVSLQAGQGVHGTILTPEGQPASDAQVVMLRPAPNSRHHPYGFASLSAGKFGRQTARNHDVVEADREGAFVFSPAQDVHPIYVAHPTGFGVVKAPPVGDALTIRLQAWAGVTGGVINLDKQNDWFVQLSQRRPRVEGETPRPSSRGFLSTIKRRLGGTVMTSEEQPLMPSISSIVLPRAASEFRFDHIPPGKWWVTLSRKEILPDKGVYGVYTLKAVDTVEIEAKPGEVVSVALAAPDSLSVAN